MNIKNLIAAAAVFTVAGSALAEQTYPYVDFAGVQSTRTRAEVTAELNQAQAQRGYVIGGQEFAAPDATFAGTRSRSQVAAELQRAQEEGTYMVGGEEYAGQQPAARSTVRRLASN
jgi:hypothetical protein